MNVSWHKKFHPDRVNGYCQAGPVSGTGNLITGRANIYFETPLDRY